MGKELERSKILQRSLPTAKVKTKMKWVGIDFGAKQAGTTCLSFANKGKLFVTQSEKGKDADAWLQAQVDDLNPSVILIDAPLSLPPAFFSSTFDDFFYRNADRELKAMSPMFLGGLTARAMRHKKSWEAASRQVLETYPAAAVRQLKLTDYKKDKSKLIAQLNTELEQHQISLAKNPTNWHQIDSILAWISGKRFVDGVAQCVGDSSGYIFI